MPNIQNKERKSRLRGGGGGYMNRGCSLYLSSGRMGDFLSAAVFVMRRVNKGGQQVGYMK